MILTRSRGPRPGVLAGIATGILGVALLAAGYALEAHAGDAPQVPRGQPFQITGPSYLMAIAEPGADTEQPATCTTAAPTGTTTIRVGTRLRPYEGIPAGRRVHATNGTKLTVVCDRRVAVATGLPVHAYPLAAFPILKYGHAGLAVLGFGYARRRARTARSPVSPGHPETRSAWQRLASDTALTTTATAACLLTALVAVVGTLTLARGAPAGAAVLAAALLPGGVTLAALRRRTRPRADRQPDTGRDRGGGPIEMAITMPLMLVCVFAVAHLGMYYLARQAALSVAQVAVEGERGWLAEPGAGHDRATEFHHRLPGVLHHPDIQVSNDGVHVTATVTGNPISVIPWLTTTVTQAATAPVERVA